MAKLFAWEQVQTLWTKIKNTFVAKDSNGKATVDDLDVVNDITLQGSIISSGGGATYNDEVAIRKGYSLRLHNEDESFNVGVCCDDEGMLCKEQGGVRTPLTTTIDVNLIVNKAIANAPHLTREKVSALPGVATAKENVIYMVSNSTTGDNKFDEYMLIDGAWEKTGSSDVDLSGYPTTEEMNTAISNSYTLITDAEIDSLS